MDVELWTNLDHLSIMHLVRMTKYLYMRPGRSKGARDTRPRKR